MTINLQITKGVNNIVTEDYNEMDLVKYCHNREWSSIGNLIITNVPEVIEYEISKYIFNKVEIDEMHGHNLELLISIKGKI